MDERKMGVILTVLLVIVIVAIIGLGGYMGISYYKDYKKSKESGISVNSFIEETNNVDTDNLDNNELGNISDYVNGTNSESNTGTSKWTYKGFNVIGVIEIPKTKVKYFVLEDPPTKKSLEVSVVALYPKNAELNKIGNVVISGHNYRNGLFFSDNKKLVKGDKIYITDLNKNKVEYTIYNIFQTDKNDVSYYNRDTNGKMEITLYSCTDAGDDQRIIIEARAE